MKVLSLYIKESQTYNSNAIEAISDAFSELPKHQDSTRQQSRQDACNCHCHLQQQSPAELDHTSIFCNLSLCWKVLEILAALVSAIHTINSTGRDSAATS